MTAKRRSRPVRSTTAPRPHAAHAQHGERRRRAAPSESNPGLSAKNLCHDIQRLADQIREEAEVAGLGPSRAGRGGASRVLCARSLLLDALAELQGTDRAGAEKFLRQYLRDGPEGASA